MTFKSIKFNIFKLNASSVEYSTDPVEYTTEVEQLIFSCYNHSTIMVSKNCQPLANTLSFS